MMKQQYMNIDTSNVYKGMQNVYEDLTVNTQAADFLAQQQQQALANTMDAVSGAAGGSGIASLAQAMAGQQSMNLQQASANIAQQEQQNQILAAQGANQIQMAEAQGELISRQQQEERASTLLGMSQQRVAAANQARQQATQSIIGGIGQVAGVAAQGLFGGSGNFMDNLGLRKQT
jgi:hypothetical protein